MAFVGIASWFGEQEPVSAAGKEAASEWGTGGFKDIIFVVVLLAYVVERAPTWIRGMRGALLPTTENGKAGKISRYDTESVKLCKLIESLESLADAVNDDLKDRQDEREIQRRVEQRQGQGESTD